MPIRHDACHTGISAFQFASGAHRDFHRARDIEVERGSHPISADVDPGQVPVNQSLLALHSKRSSGHQTRTTSAIPFAASSGTAVYILLLEA
jgi:hypothetical protein